MSEWLLKSKALCFWIWQCPTYQPLETQRTTSSTMMKDRNLVCCLGASLPVAYPTPTTVFKRCGVEPVTRYYAYHRNVRLPSCRHKKAIYLCLEDGHGSSQTVDSNFLGAIRGHSSAVFFGRPQTHVSTRSRLIHVLGDFDLTNGLKNLVSMR